MQKHIAAKHAAELEKVHEQVRKEAGKSKAAAAAAETSSSSKRRGGSSRSRSRSVNLRKCTVLHILG